jgi:hypothetical protein
MEAAAIMRPLGRDADPRLRPLGQQLMHALKSTLVV